MNILKSVVCWPRFRRFLPFQPASRLDRPAYVHGFGSPSPPSDCPLVTLTLPLLLPACDFATTPSDPSLTEEARQQMQEGVGDQVTAFRIQEIDVGARTEQLHAGGIGPKKGGWSQWCPAPTSVTDNHLLGEARPGLNWFRKVPPSPTRSAP